MAVPRSCDRMPVNVIVDGTTEIISLEQASFLIDRQKSEGCIPECLSCHFRERYLRDLEPDIVESVLANEFQVTDRPIQGGEVVVGYVTGVPVIVPSGIYWDILQLKDSGNEQIRKYIKRSWKFPISQLHIRMIFLHWEDGLDTDENGLPIYPDEVEPPAHDGHYIETLPTTPVTPRFGRPRSSFSMVPPEYSPRPSWNGVQLRHPHEVVAYGGQVAPFYPTEVTPEPPSYASCGPFEQPPTYELQQLQSSIDPLALILASSGTSVTGSPRLGQVSSTILTSEAVQSTTTGVAASNTPPVFSQNPTRLQEQSAHVPGLLASSSDQKYTYTSEQLAPVLPTREQVIRYLTLPRLVRQDADHASLSGMIDQAVSSMDRTIDEFVDLVEAYENPGALSPLTSPTASSASLPDFPLPPQSSERHPMTPHATPAGRLSSDHESSEDESGDFDSVSYGDGHTVDSSDDGDEKTDGPVHFCTEAVAQMLVQDDVARKVLSFYPSHTSWNIGKLMEAFGRMKWKRSVMECEEEDWSSETSWRMSFNVEPQHLDMFLLQHPDDLLTSRPVAFDPKFRQLSDFTQTEVQVADSTSDLADVICDTIVQELLTADSMIHRVVAEYPADTKFTLPMMLKILQGVAFCRRMSALDARVRQFAIDAFPMETFDPALEYYCEDLEEPTLQELTCLGRHPYCLEAAKRENPEMMQAILAHVPDDSMNTITLTRAFLALLESSKKDQDPERRDDQARSSLSNSIATLQRLVDHVSAYERMIDAEAQFDQPTRPTIFNNVSTIFDDPAQPTSPSAFNSHVPAIFDEVSLPISPTGATTGPRPSDWFTYSRSSIDWNEIYHPNREPLEPTSPYTLTTRFEQEYQYQVYRPANDPLTPTSSVPGDRLAPLSPTSSVQGNAAPPHHDSSTPTSTPHPFDFPLNARTTLLAVAARTVRELHAFSHCRFSLIRDDEFLDDKMARAVESFAERVRQVEGEIDGFAMGPSGGGETESGNGNGNGRRGAVSG